jgi:predicted permease
VVAIENWDRAARKAEHRSLHDFLAWRDELKSVHDVGAFREVDRNLIAPGGQPETVRVAEITASGFRVARVPAIFGRYLLDDDERPSAQPVLVIGYDVWRSRFASDPVIVGRTVRLGDTTYLIVGVMPEDFGFPINHRFWVPLRTNASQYDRGTGPEVFIFGRLAPGATLESAQAELTMIGQQAAAAFPKTHEQLRPIVLPYTYQFSDMDDPENVLTLRLMELLVTLLLVLISVNVAILVYARTAARHGEIAVRSALGAGRIRIVGQLFMEALVLSLAAAALGLALVTVALRQLDTAVVQFAGQLPFWLDFGLSSAAMVYTVALTVLAAAIVGVVPALKATGRGVHTRLQSLSLGGGSSMQLGRTWTVLIVAQVAIAVALLPAAIFHAWTTTRAAIADPGVTATKFLTAQLVMDRADSPTAGSDTHEQDFTSRQRGRYAEVWRRLKAEPDFADATFALAVPGAEPTVWVEAEGVAMPAESGAEASNYAVRSGIFGHEVRFNRVDVGFFAAFDVPFLVGRGFDEADARATSSAVIVNRSFTERIAGGSNVLGRHVRYVGRSGGARAEYVELGRWYEVVGVVGDFPAKATGVGLVDAKLYHAAAPGQMQPLTLAARVRGTAQATVAGRLREIAAAVDPSLQLRDVFMMDEVLRREQGVARLVAAVLVVVTLSVVLLSAAGIYSMMSFSVTQRRREIAIRAALGADPRRILGSIFSRAMGQLAIGAVLGVVAAALQERASRGDLMEGNGAVVLPIVVVFMTVVALLAALGPARRGLRIDPAEALRTEG